MNIIVLDDETLALAALIDAIREALPDETPIGFDNAGDALRYAGHTSIDVAFLDIRMDGMNGLELAERLVLLCPTTNIIFVTGHIDYLDKAFELYASGYIKKPAMPKRIRKEMAHLRYPHEDNPPVRLVRELGPYVFDHIKKRVYHNGRDTLLKPKEFSLLCVLAGAPGVFFSQERLLQMVWGLEANGDVRTVYAHASRLRIKLAMNVSGSYDIETRRNVGYRLTTPQTDCAFDSCGRY